MLCFEPFGGLLSGNTEVLAVGGPEQRASFLRHTSLSPRLRSQALCDEKVFSFYDLNLLF